MIKIGGGTLAGGALEDLPDLLSAGHKIVIVHGGGLQLTRMLDALHIPTRFHAGLRVTDEETIEVAENVFGGGEQRPRARAGRSRCSGSGHLGDRRTTLLVEPVPDLGRVGKVVRVVPQLIEALWTGGFVPVVAPLGLGPEGVYNVNADSAAAALAVGLGAGHLFLLTDVDGLLEEGETVGALDPEGARPTSKAGSLRVGWCPSCGPRLKRPGRGGRQDPQR